ncbi:MAG: FecR domain-containing protein [Candidatus Uhrbacteria bacterium]|nr:FecR domain-containing protein [Candidatus Uhrbacteria bacterium]
MRQKILAILFILCVFALIVANRFDFTEQVTAKVSRDTGTSYSIGHVFRRGETIHTSKGEFVELFIGGMVVIDLDENTNLELKSLARNAVRVGFGHGRILVNLTNNDGGNLEVDTPTAQHQLVGRASFIGYDFKHETSVIPLFLLNTGSIHTTIPLLNQTFELTSPMTIHDVNPPTVEEITFDEKTDARAEFYLWAAGK